jgi:hypothetical protein
MKKILLIGIIMILFSAVFVNAMDNGTSYHEELYTNKIRSISLSHLIDLVTNPDAIIFNHPINAESGFIIDTCASNLNSCPETPEPGQMWLITDETTETGEGSNI